MAEVKIAVVAAHVSFRFFDSDLPEIAQTGRLQNLLHWFHPERERERERERKREKYYIYESAESWILNYLIRRNNAGNQFQEKKNHTPFAYHELT